MEIRLPVLQGLSLTIDDAPPAGGRYATSRLQRGWLLRDGDLDLAEEAVGFGVPVLKRGLETIFPGAVTLDHAQRGGVHSITARFELNLVERFSRPADGVLQNRFFYAVKDLLAATMRRVPPTRGPLTAASSGLRRCFGWETTYAEAGFGSELTVVYTAEPAAGRLVVETDTASLRPDITEVVLMHEQGARHFHCYREDSGILLQDDQIGCWDEVHAAEAWFENRARRIAFGVRRLDGAQLFRGRELIGSRLAWAGFGYSFAPAVGRHRHELTISRLP
jgi:hypothetical protein